MSGELHKVTFYAKQKCNSDFCTQMIVATVATVYFDCDDKVMDVECTAVIK